MSEQDDTQASDLEPPDNLNIFAWRAYWESQGQPWRSEPEINRKRQIYLIQRLNIVPINGQGIYPFKNVKLTRADVEWLLATHENERGPVDWSDQKQRNRKGLDLRGADLREVDLSRLPLSCLNGGFDDVWVFEGQQFEAPAIHLEGANLVYAHLEGANLYGAHLEGANLSFSILTKADLRHAHLQRTNFSNVDLKGAALDFANLEKSIFKFAILEKAYLVHTHLEGANLELAHLEGAAFDEAFFDNTTNLYGIFLSNEQSGGVHFADVHWSDVNVAVVDWSTLPMLGQELTTQKPRNPYASKRDHAGMLSGSCKNAARAYRQLAVVLRDQGLNEDAARFIYRAQLMQREVYRHRRKNWQYLGSFFLDLLTGYGYKPMRSFFAYLIVITTFAVAYFIIGRTVGPALSPLGSVVFSMTSFHGRGFFPGSTISLDDPLTVLAALEAFVGLLIEVTFIATLTQRLFGK